MSTTPVRNPVVAPLAKPFTPGQTLGAHLRQTRLRAGLSVPDAVVASGVSRPFVYMIEAGTRRPSGETLTTLLRAYKATDPESAEANRLHTASAPASESDDG